MVVFSQKELRSPRFGEFLGWFSIRCVTLKFSVLFLLPAWLECVAEMNECLSIPSTFPAKPGKTSCLIGLLFAQTNLLKPLAVTASIANRLDKGVIVYICDSRGVRDIYDTDGSNAIAASEPLVVLVC